MNLETVKTLLKGKWKSIEDPKMIIEFKNNNRVDINSNPQTSGGFIYSLILNEFNLFQLSAPNIGFYFCFITEITEFKMIIAKMSDKQREGLNISKEGKILSNYDIWNFTRE